MTSRESAVLPRQDNPTSSEDWSHPRHDSKRFFSAPKRHVPSQSVNWPRNQPLPPPPLPLPEASQFTEGSIPMESNDLNSATPKKKLIRSAAHANQILAEYSNEHGEGYPHPITTTLREGKSRKRKRILMPDRLTAQYRAEPMMFDNVVLPLLASGVLTRKDLGKLEVLNQRFSRVVPKFLSLRDIDSTPLQLPRLDYAAQQNIDQHRVDMASAQFIRCGGDPAKLVRYCANEYILEELDREGILRRVKGIASPEDYRHLERILFDGCPAEFNFTEDAKSRQRSFERGNQPTYYNRPEKTKKALNKEDKNSFVIPIDEDLAYMSLFCRHTPQAAIDKRGKSYRIVWDGSTKDRHDDTVMNDVTPTEKEAPITFGEVERLLDEDIYELRVSYLAGRPAGARTIGNFNPK
jgi:hypothetical protein